MKLEEIRLAIRALACLGKYKDAFSVVQHAPGASRGSLRHRLLCLHCGWDIDPTTRDTYSTKLYAAGIDSPGWVHYSCIKTLVNTDENRLSAAMQEVFRQRSNPWAPDRWDELP